MDEINMTDAEAEQLLSDDPTPVGYKKSAADRKAAAAYMRQYRADKKDHQAIEELKPRRSDLDALFEMDGRLMETADEMLQSALLFAFYLGLEKPQPGQSLIDYGTQLFNFWREAGFPLKCFGPDGTKLIYEGFVGSLPTLWPAGSENQIDMDRVYWAEKLERDADRIQAHWLNRKETYWRWNPITRFYEPEQVFQRPEFMDELATARAGYRWEVQKGFDHPLMVRHEGLADSSFRMSREDLMRIMNEDFARCEEELKGRKP